MAEPTALHLCRPGDVLFVDEKAFESACAAHAIQSLKYGEGTIVNYEYAALQRWVLETVIHHAPVFQTLIPMFPFAGEGIEASGPVGGVEQVELPRESMIAIEKEMASLEACARCQNCLTECMDFLHILGGKPDTPIGTYCADTLRLSEQDLMDLGPPSSTVRNVVRLAHLRSLGRLLKERLVDPLANVDPSYTDPLPEELREECDEAAKVMDLRLLCAAMKANLTNNFQGFLQPAAATTSLGGNACGWLDFQQTDEEDGQGGKKILYDYEWFGAFPADLHLAHFVACYELFDSVRGQEDTFGNSASVSSRVALFEKLVQ